jgi:hypothetical protein
VSGPGHNRGPSLEGGTTWRAHCWRRARTELLPVLPLEVVRLRVRRAKEIGLDYRTYAGVRATTGHDIVAFLFSTNALRVLRDGQAVEAARKDKLARLTRVGTMIAAQPPVDPDRLRQLLAGQGIAVQATVRAPGLTDGWSATRGILSGLLREARHPADRVLVIGDTALEAGWAGAARMAGYLQADRYFGAEATG